MGFRSVTLVRSPSNLSRLYVHAVAIVGDSHRESLPGSFDECPAAPRDYGPSLDQVYGSSRKWACRLLYIAYTTTVHHLLLNTHSFTVPRAQVDLLAASLH